MNLKSDFKEDVQFRKEAERSLMNLLEQIDDLEVGDFDPRYTPGSLIVQFEDDAVFMLSMQTPTHELWLSANYTAWHFLCVEGIWIERDTQERMLDVLNQLFSDKLQEKINLV